MQERNLTPRSVSVTDGAELSGVPLMIIITSLPETLAGFAEHQRLSLKYFDHLAK